jgi:hypothetical protein
MDLLLRVSVENVVGRNFPTGTSAGSVPARDELGFPVLDG